ncbi:MAG: hypothetical protein Q8Q63_13325 [Phaeovulum sp.]|uniref:hypothetical protein n=1 Tax=Phaeovulum sp. TaxID=2934796 RepID=UPI002734AB83|nr:hypothetical protein [Phaeovulum sp.]MDP3862554.1 hypothetical protein [Phaeovulum sp.]
MVDEAATDAANTRPSLFVEAGSTETFAGADALICTAGDGEAAAAAAAPLIWRCAPGSAVPAGARVCVADGGLGAAAQLRAAAGGAFVVPRVEVQRAARRYGFATDASGSGFSTYHLDPATAAGFDVDDGGRQMSLADWLAEAARLGFAEVWLHSRDAAATGRGFAADLLARAHRLAPHLGLWLSGGGASAEDIERVASRPGLVALVVPQAALATTGVGDPPDTETDGRPTA